MDALHAARHSREAGDVRCEGFLSSYQAGDGHNRREGNCVFPNERRNKGVGGVSAAIAGDGCHLDIRKRRIDSPACEETEGDVQTGD